jgi:phenylpropionate dioxygenase-like ring-hydroxylating dioxygenase large terminal subunit
MTHHKIFSKFGQNKTPKLMNTSQIQSLLDCQKPNYSMTQEMYTSSKVFDIEILKIWRKLWLFAGTTASIAKPGDFFTYKIGKDNVIIVRGNKGEVFAHHNTCRHRGSLVCLEEKGNAPVFMCPYHQWVYDKDGKLLKARLMPDDFCKEDHGLPKVNCQVIEGFIFICLDENPPSFDQVRKDFAPFLAPFHVDDAKIAFSKKYTLKTNWKLIGENFRECYHCGPAHPEYCGAVIGANMLESADETLLEKQPIWTQKGLATETISFKYDTNHFAVRYPLRPDVASYSLNGKAVSIPMGDHKDYDAGVLGMVVYPNFWMDAVSDYMWTMRLTAISASETVIDLCWLVDMTAVQDEDYEVDRLTEFWKITGEQDWKLCENNFAGIESSAYRPGPYSPAEDDVAQYVAWYLRMMGKSNR